MHTPLGSCHWQAVSTAGQGLCGPASQAPHLAYPRPEAEPGCTRSPVRGLARREKQPPYPAAFAIYPGDCFATTNFLDADLNEAASAADASRDTIWQGNCAVAALQSRSNIAPIRNTIPIQYPISNCPAEVGGFLQVAVSKARRAAVSPTPPPGFRRRASDTALRLRGSHTLHFYE
jgi:hypothetical protein